MMVETLEQGQFTISGEYYFSEAGCLLRVVVELEPHNACLGGNGTLLVPLVPGDDTHNVGYSCEKCGEVVFQHAQGICL